MRARHVAKPAQSATLEQLVQHEAQENQRHATACLVRLIRWVLVELPLSAAVV